MSRLSSLSFAAAVLFASALPIPTQAALAEPEQCIAVFDFELIDRSLEGELRGTNSAEQRRLGLLGEQLRKWLAAEGRHKVCDMSPVAAEAKAANLSACGCILRLASRVGGKLAIVGAVHKISNLILNITVDVFDIGADERIIQLNVDIRSNTDRSWTRGLDWLIEHRLAGAFGAAEP